MCVGVCVCVGVCGVPATVKQFVLPIPVDNMKDVTV